MTDHLDEAVSLDDLAPSAPTLPDGEYELEVVEATTKQTKQGGGQYINYRAVVQSGDHAGKSLFGMWSTKPSVGKQDMTYITRGDWKRLEVGGITVAADLIGTRGVAKVKEQFKKDETGELTDEKENVIKKWIRRA